MTLPASGVISLSDVNVELGLSSTAAISLDDSAVRTLFGIGSGAISMSNGYGKANQFAFSFAGGTNVDLRATAIAAGWNGTSKVIATNTGTISSASTGSYALTISGSFPNGVTFTNNALIIGRGGDGGKGNMNGTNGGNAGPALFVSTAVTITNNSTISGGGGGGGGGGVAQARSNISGGGGGGGGIGVSAAGAAGDAPGAGSWVPSAGQPGTISTAGSGGLGSSSQGNGGAGGSYASSGTGGSAVTNGGFVWAGPTGAGAGGAAVVGNSNITWAATGTILGSIS